MAQIGFLAGPTSKSLRCGWYDLYDLNRIIALLRQARTA